MVINKRSCKNDLIASEAEVLEHLESVLGYDLIKYTPGIDSDYYAAFESKNGYVLGIYVLEKPFSGMRYLGRFLHLKKLRIFFLGLTEIEGLNNLTKLERLDLSYNDIQHIKGLESLINLKYLNLAGNQISEIKGLEKLISLEFLNLSENKISKVKGLETLKKIKKLWLDGNPIPKKELILMDKYK